MLTYHRSEKLGSFVARELHADGIHKFDISIYRGNCLAVFVHHYAAPDGMQDMLYAFFADKQHMNNIAKDHTPEHPFFDIEGQVFLNMNYKESESLLLFFARQGQQIAPYYEH